MRPVVVAEMVVPVARAVSAVRVPRPMPTAVGAATPVPALRAAWAAPRRWPRVRVALAVPAVRQAFKPKVVPRAVVPARRELQARPDLARRPVTVASVAPVRRALLSVPVVSVAPAATAALRPQRLRVPVTVALVALVALATLASLRRLAARPRRVPLAAMAVRVARAAPRLRARLAPVAPVVRLEPVATAVRASRV